MDDLMKKFLQLWRKNPIIAIVWLFATIAITVIASLYFTSCTASLFVQRGSPSSKIQTTTEQTVSADSASINLNPSNKLLK